MRKTILSLLLAGFALTGCVPLSPQDILNANVRALTLGAVDLKDLGVNRMTPRQVGDEITVDPQIVWAAAPGALTGGASARWTVDGFALDDMRFMIGIAPGDPLLRFPDVDRKDMLVYSTTMLPDDVMEMVAGTLSRVGFQQVRSNALRPAPFGGVTGFRFNFTYTTTDGLEMKGTALFAQRRNKLDVILFTAPAEYYFDHYLPVVEKVLASVRVPVAPAMRAAN